MNNITINKDTWINKLEGTTGDFLVVKCKDTGRKTPLALKRKDRTDEQIAAGEWGDKRNVPQMIEWLMHKDNVKWRDSLELKDAYESDGVTPALDKNGKQKTYFIIGDNVSVDIFA